MKIKTLWNSAVIAAALAVSAPEPCNGTAVACDTLGVVVPFDITGRASVEQGISDLRRHNREYGVNQVIPCGCPGLVVRLEGWSPSLERFERFGDINVQVKRGHYSEKQTTGAMNACVPGVPSDRYRFDFCWRLSERLSPDGSCRG